MRVNDEALFGVELRGVVTTELREAMKRHCTTPGYVNLLRELTLHLSTWVKNHPKAELRWKNTSAVMVLGNPEAPGALSRLADSSDAEACLDYADRETGRRASLFTLQLALIGLGWMRR